jgi:hypothetical protein
MQLDQEQVLLVGVGGQRGDEGADEYGLEAWRGLPLVHFSAQRFFVGYASRLGGVSVGYEFTN